MFAVPPIITGSWLSSYYNKQLTGTLRKAVGNQFRPFLMALLTPRLGEIVAAEIADEACNFILDKWLD
jgi:hypothetical protein